MVKFLIFGDGGNIFLLLLILILGFFCLWFYLDIQKLKRKVDHLEQETKEILERKIISGEKADLVEINSLSEENVAGEVEKSRENENLKRVGDVSMVSSSQEEKLVSKSGEKEMGVKADLALEKSELIARKLNEYYSLKQSLTMQQSEVTELNQVGQKSVENTDKEVRFDLNEFIKRSERVVPKVVDSREYLQEISEKMAKELKPQTIELTDYEKDQEDHAIISYQELLSARDGIRVKDDEKELEFIDELKKFRNNLS